MLIQGRSEKITRIRTCDLFGLVILLDVSVPLGVRCKQMQAEDFIGHRNCVLLIADNKLIFINRSLFIFSSASISKACFEFFVP